jgi:hypothetical protein
MCAGKAGNQDGKGESLEAYRGDIILEEVHTFLLSHWFRLSPVSVQPVGAKYNVYLLHREKKDKDQCKGGEPDIFADGDPIKTTAKEV